MVEKSASSSREVLDGRGARAALLDLERVETADDDPDGAAEVDLRDRRVAEYRALGHQLAAFGADRGDLHRDARAEAGRQTGAHLEPEQTAAEQRVFVAARLDRRRHRVDDRLGEPFGPGGTQRLGCAICAQRGAEIVGDALADEDRVAFAADRRGEPCALGDGAE